MSNFIPHTFRRPADLRMISRSRDKKNLCLIWINIVLRKDLTKTTCTHPSLLLYWPQEKGTGKIKRNRHVGRQEETTGIRRWCGCGHEGDQSHKVSLCPKQGCTKGSDAPNKDPYFQYAFTRAAIKAQHIPLLKLRQRARNPEGQKVKSSSPLKNNATVESPRRACHLFPSKHLLTFGCWTCFRSCPTSYSDSRRIFELEISQSKVVRPKHWVSLSNWFDSVVKSTSSWVGVGNYITNDPFRVASLWNFHDTLCFLMWKYDIFLK